MSLESKVTISSFKRIPKIQEAPSVNWLQNEEYFFNVILIASQSNQQYNQNLKDLQDWIRKDLQVVKLMKINKIERFKDVYNFALNDVRKSFFITNLSVESINDEPIMKLYMENANIQTLEKQVKENVKKINFLILKEEIKGLDKRNYFHNSISLITSQLECVKNQLSLECQSLQKINSTSKISSSSINTEEINHFKEDLYQQHKEQAKYEMKKTNRDNTEYDCLKKIKDTPGVGTYSFSSSFGNK